MKNFIIFLFLIISLSHITMARDITDVNWPSLKSMDLIEEDDEDKNKTEKSYGMPVLLAPDQSFSDVIKSSCIIPQSTLTEVIVIELNKEVNEEILEYLEEMGCKIELYIFNLVQVRIEKEKIEKLRKMEFIRYLREPSEINEDSIIIKTLPSLAIDDFSNIHIKEVHKNGYLGQGIKIAILDTGFDPSNSLLKKNIIHTESFRSKDKNIKAGDYVHGNAVTEIVTRIAPKAKIILANFQTDVEYIKALKEIINYPPSLKPDIILTTVNIVLPDDYYDGTGVRASLAKLAREKNINLVTSAGNNAQTHYKGNFSDTNSNSLHNFTKKDDTLEVDFKKNDKIKIILSWKDNWKSPKEDLNLGIFDDNLNPIKISQRKQISSKLPPYEFIDINAPYSGPYHIAVKKGEKTSYKLPFMIYIYSGTAQNMEYFSPETSLDPGLPTSSYGITVGAVKNMYPYILEPWSSQGKTTDERIKPDIVAISGIYCTTKNGLFWGTSSAAPQVAGAIALMLSKNHFLLPEQIKSILGKTATDLGEPGPDPLYGSGLINIYKAIKLI